MCFTHRCVVGTGGNGRRVDVTIGQLAVRRCVDGQAVIGNAALSRVILCGKGVLCCELCRDSILRGVLGGVSLGHGVRGTAGLLVTLETSMQMKEHIKPRNNSLFKVIYEVVMVRAALRFK